MSQTVNVTSFKHFTDSFIATDKKNTRYIFHARDIAFKIQTELNCLRFNEGMSRIHVNSRVYFSGKFEDIVKFDIRNFS